MWVLGAGLGEFEPDPNTANTRINKKQLSETVG